MPPKLNPLEAIKQSRGAKTVMSLADEVRAEMAAEKAAQKPPALIRYELEEARKAKEASQPPVKASEAYGKHEGSYIKPIFYDRMKVDLEKRKLGGPGFSGIQLIDPEYAKAKAVAGVTDKKMGTRILNRNKAQVPKGAKVIWTPSVGGLEQHKSNSTMFSEFADIFANERKNLSPEQIQKMSDYASTKVDNAGRLIFPNGIDLGSRNFRKAVKTYNQRALMADIFAGRGVGGEKGRTVPMEELLQKNLDPNMAEAGTLDLGNRLFRLDDNVIDRPDLHSDYPIIATGEDLDVNYLPTPIASVFEDFKVAKELEKGRDITQMDYTKNDPTQLLSEGLLTRLQKAGYRQGGLAKMGKGGAARGMKKLKGIYSEVETSMGKGKGAEFEQTASPLNIMREGTGQWTGKNLDVQLKDLEDEAFSPAYQKMIEGSIKSDRERAAKGDKVAQARVEVFEKVLARGLAKKQWVNSNLKNYVKKQMASPNDPVRALAEKGVTHIRDNGQAWRGGVPRAETNRMRAGLPTLGSGQSVEAKAWETLSDNSMSSMLPEDVPLSLARGNEWIKDLPEDERVLFYTHTPDLGFEKLLQHIDTKLDAGEIRPDQLNKVSVADAVKGVHDKRVSEEDLAKKVMQSNAATKVVKEYPNGYKWVEISANKDSPLPEGYEQLPNGTYVDPQGQGSIHNPNYIAMQDALTHEGNIMGHCVGDYCDEVYNKGTKILSLRDPKGESHATVQVLPQENGPPRIKQIKGKHDEPLIGKYRPMMADLANTGEYSYIDELHNAGLKEKSTVLDAHEEEWLKSKGYQVPKYLLQEDVDVMLKALDDNGVPPIPKTGMAKGGVPKGAKKIMSLADQVRAEMAAEKAGAKVLSKEVGMPKGIKHLLFEDYTPNEVELVNLEAVQKGMGYGSSAMNKITHAADKNKINMMLIPAGDEAKRARLSDFYGRFGFSEDGDVMRRNHKARGGLAYMGKGGAPKGVKKVMSLADQVRAEMAAEKQYGQVAGMVSKMGEEGRSPILPVPNRWFLQPDKFPNQQKLIERVLQQTGMRREDFPSGAFIDPRTGEVLDSRIMDDLGVVINPATNRPMMSAKGQSGLEVLDPKTGSYTKSNLVRKGLFKPEGGDPMLNDLSFLATIEKGDVGHKYGLATEYASPTELYNTGTGANPTLRPRSRGDLFGVGDVVGQVRIGKSNPHDVYEKLFVAPKGSNVQGKKLSKAHGGLAHMAKGGRGVRGAEKVMSLADQVRAEMAAEKAAKLANPPANVKVEPAYPYQDRLNKVKPVYGARKILPREQADANKAAFLEPSTDKRRLYHGTKRNFTRFSPTTADSIFLTPDPTFASGFAHGSLEFKDPYSQVAHGRFSTPNAKFKDPEEQVDNANILPVRVQVRNPFDYENAEHIDALRDWMVKNSGMPKDRIDRQLQYMSDPELSTNWTQMENPEFQKAIKALGHDAYYTKELDTKNLGVYNPNMVKSDIGNIGTWSTKTPEITEKKGGLV